MCTCMIGFSLLCWPQREHSDRKVALTRLLKPKARLRLQTFQKRTYFDIVSLSESLQMFFSLNQSKITLKILAQHTLMWKLIQQKCNGLQQLCIYFLVIKRKAGETSQGDAILIYIPLR